MSQCDGYDDDYVVAGGDGDGVVDDDTYADYDDDYANIGEHATLLLTTIIILLVVIPMLLMVITIAGVVAFTPLLLYDVCGDAECGDTAVEFF